MRFLLLYFCVVFTVYAQEDKYTIELKDYHSNQITEILVTKDNQTLVTKDESGKIIIWDASDFSYVRTIKKADDFPVNDMRLAFKDKGLIYKKSDTLYVINAMGELISKKKMEVNIINKKNSDFIVFTSKDTKTLTSEIIIVNDQFKSQKSFKIKDKAPISSLEDVATVNKQGDFIAYAVENYNNKSYQYVAYRNIATNTVIWETTVEDDHNIGHLFFNKEGTNLYAITISEKEETLSVYEYKDGKRALTPEIKIPYKYPISSTSFSDFFVENNKIVVSTKSSLKYKPILISKKGDKFSADYVELPNGSHTTVQVLKNEQLISADVFEKNFNDIATFSVYSFNKKKYLKTYPNFSQEFYSGMFLPDDSWMTYGNKPGKDVKIKYYEKGTFYNRFQTLNLSDYIEINHNVHGNFNSYELNKTTGNIIFSGKDKETEKYNIFKYNFIDDEVISLFEIDDKFYETIDYNEATNSLLLSPKKYYNRGYTEPQPLILSINNKTKKLSGTYKFAKFSNSGNRFLTISKDNLVQIHNKKQKLLFEKQLTEGSYVIYALGDNEFIISKTYTNSDFDKCLKKTITFLPEGNTYKTQEQDCVFINDLAVKNKQTAMIMEGVGILLNDKLIKLSYTEMPKNISFNKDGSKLMVSYSNGGIAVLNTQTQEELGGSFHPSEKEHIFYDNKNHYFSNTDVNDFLRVKKDGKTTTFTEADASVFKPNEVLKVFGTPNEEYQKLVEKAIVLRKNKKDFNTIKTNNTKTEKSTEKGNLYVLSIGVSEYKQANYNLTFADKDAFDIANLYGELDAKTVEDFNTKFLGEKYSLQSHTGKNEGALKKFVQQYGNIGDLYPVGKDGNIWLEINDYKNESFIWNYTEKTIQNLELPKDFTKDLWGKQFFASPDNKFFYIKTEDGKIHQYSLKSLKRKEITIPFDIKNYSESIHPLENNKWSYFKPSNGLDNHFKLYFGKTNTTKIDSLKINTNFYKDFSDKKIKESTSAIYSPYFKDITNNGKYLLFKAREKDLFLIEVGKDSIPTKLTIPIDKLDEASISSDGKRVTILKTSSSDYSHKAITYSLDGKILDNTTLKDENYSVRGISIANANPKWIQQSASMVDRVNYSFKMDKNLVNATPSSFKKVHVKYITNEGAKKTTVEKTIKDFFSRAKENDQILLFIAGHGVLDAKNNYYYAPYNMDFSNITKNGVPFKTIINGLSSSKASQKLLLMDTCHAGNTLDVADNSSISSKPQKDGQRGSIVVKSSKKKIKFKLSNVVSGLFADFLSNSGVTVLSASSGGDVAFENKELGNGAFTTAYIKVLQEKLAGTSYINEEKLKKTITLNDGFINKVLKQVILLTDGKQIPDVRELNKNIEVKVW